MRIRLDNIDHTLAHPGSLDDSTLPKVPVIRIFGLTSTGLRACLHVHQVYPYFFIDYYGSLNPDRVKTYIHKLTKSLNHAIALSLHRNPHGSNAQYIRAIILVKGVPFYGFHTVYQPYLKVILADPTWVSRSVTILQSGGVMGTKFKTYENHLSYYLQFMCDYGLYGCGWVDLGDEVYLRGKDTDRLEADDERIENLKLLPSPYFRQSHLPLELDTCAHQIQNRHIIEARDFHSTLRIPASNPSAEPLVHSVRELWEDERRRRIAKGLSASPDMPKLLSERKRGKGGKWVDLDRLQAIVDDKCERETKEGRVYRERNKSWEKWVMSTFESVEALWDSSRRTWKPTRDGKEDKIPSGDWSLMTTHDKADDTAELDVDENLLSSQGMDKLMRDEEQQDAIPDKEDQNDEEDDPGDDPIAEDGFPPELQSQEELQNQEMDDFFCSKPRSLPVLQSEPLASDKGIFKPENPSLLYSSPSSGAKLTENRNSFYEAQRTDAQSSLSITPVANDTLNVASTFSTSPTDHAITHLGSFLTSSSSRTSATNFSQGTEGLRAPKNGRIEPVDSELKSPSDVEDSQTFTTEVIGSSTRQQLIYALSPPSTSSLLNSIPAYDMVHKEYRDPYYSQSEDLPERPREYAGLVFDLTRGTGTTFLPPWASEEADNVKTELLGDEGVTGWEYAGWPPNRQRVVQWLRDNREAQNLGKYNVKEERFKRKTHIEGQTQENIYGFGATLDQHVDSTREKQNMSILALEVFAKNSNGKVPNPLEDEVSIVFYSFQNQDVTEISSFKLRTGIIFVTSQGFDVRMAHGAQDVSAVSCELDLINSLIDLVLELDPDIVAGWEVQAASWGYLEARGRTFGLDVADSIGRAPARHMGGGSDSWGMRTTSTFKVTGRHVLNVWRLMRAELSLTSYSFESVAFHLLHRRVPRYTALTLTKWFNSEIPAELVRVFKYFLDRNRVLLEILDAAEVVTKTAEFARVFGIDFFSVISRGSQFKVESFMFRIAKPESFVLISPTKNDVGKQNAAECMPLIMEPYSAFYKGPLVVLDFQSLYPSVMIAYNYCYSTCLGRVQNFKGKNKLGITDLDNPPGLLSTLKEHLTISPNGIMFVKPEVRRGLLGRMLTELLETRVMVKQGMKAARGDKALLQVLEARQLSLKYIANVTYGYTSATFSGRMPAVEIADAIVQSGRETLEKAIEAIESTKKWGGRVVYGDTDSLFIYLQGKTKEQAFLIGNEMADAITAQNPAPIKLKFEKVYLPCVLMAKKRYVGFKYERPDDAEPTFDAKGIETVRRDGIPAQQKMVERCLKMLFRTQDLSAIKEYCQMSWKSILEGTVSVQDFIFAKEVKLGTYSDKGPPPPGAVVAGRRVLQDPNDEPQYGERIPYVIIRGEPGMKLVDRAVPPEELLHNSNKHIDAEYYISRVLIPPLERIFNLIGADVRSWYNAMIKGVVADNAEGFLGSPNKIKKDEEDEDHMIGAEEIAAIDSHYRSNRCVLCKKPTEEVVCELCIRNPEESLYALLARVHEVEHRLSTTHAICRSCTLSPMAVSIKCESMDCPWLYARKKAEEEGHFLEGAAELIEKIESLAQGAPKPKLVTISTSSDHPDSSEYDTLA
ncbi:hypothetical protein BU17DRAFT_92979 [Hysterangium stoloniferum]|nr:hypothetical protein BU17DRAFT_92979 [Hysterangium stoloniferum]